MAQINYSRVIVRFPDKATFLIFMLKHNLTNFRWNSGSYLCYFTPLIHFDLKNNHIYATDSVTAISIKEFEDVLQNFKRDH